MRHFIVIGAKRGAILSVLTYTTSQCTTQHYDFVNKVVEKMVLMPNDDVFKMEEEFSKRYYDREDCRDGVKQRFHAYWDRGISATNYAVDRTNCQFTVNYLFAYLEKTLQKEKTTEICSSPDIHEFKKQFSENDGAFGLSISVRKGDHPESELGFLEKYIDEPLNKLLFWLFPPPKISLGPPSKNQTLGHAFAVIKTGDTDKCMVVQSAYKHEALSKDNIREVATIDINNLIDDVVRVNNNKKMDKQFMAKWDIVMGTKHENVEEYNVTKAHISDTYYLNITSIDRKNLLNN